MDEIKARAAALAQSIDLGLHRREDISTTQMPIRRSQRTSSRIAFHPNRNISNKAQINADKDNVAGRKDTRGVGSGAWKDFTAPADEEAAQLDDLSGGQSHRRGLNFAPRAYKVDTNKPNQFSNRISLRVDDQAKARESEAAYTMKRAPLQNQNTTKFSAPLNGSESHYEGAKGNVRRMRLHQAEMEARDKVVVRKPIVHVQNEVEDVARQVSLLTDTIIEDLCKGMSQVSFQDRNDLIRSELMGLDINGPPAASMASMEAMPKLGLLTNSKWA